MFNDYQVKDGNKLTLRGAAAIVLAALVSAPVCADLGPTLEGEVDNVFENYIAETSNKATAGMVEIREKLQDGTYVTRYRQSYGVLNNNPGATATPLNVLMRQASTTKTAIVIAASKLLAENDNISRDTLVFCGSETASANGCVIPFRSKFGEDDPVYDSYTKMTIGHLMDHSSGLDSDAVGEGAAFRAIGRTRTPTIEDMIELMRSTPLLKPKNPVAPGAEAPGAEVKYSGVGYDLLGHVIETISDEGNLFDHLQNLAVELGACAGDIAPANPLMIGVIDNREPEYYSPSGPDTGRRPNLFERPDGSVGLNQLVTYPDGTGLYGALIGGGGLLMTTRAMLLFAEDYHIITGGAVPSGRVPRNGGGAGTVSKIVQRLGVFDYAYTFNGNGPTVSQDKVFHDLEAVIAKIPSSTNKTSALEFSKRYDTPCETVSDIHRPDLNLGLNESKIFTVSNADNITLFNLHSDMNLFVLELNGSSDESQVECAISGVGNNQKACSLDSEKLYEVSVFGAEPGRYMLDTQTVAQPKYSNVIEAENFLGASPFSPFEVVTDLNATYISWPSSDGPIISQGDSMDGQAHYSVRASSTTMTFFAKVNFDDANNDSFHYKLEGHTSGWSTQINQQTIGFEELEIGSWSGLIPGKMYTLKILRREDGSKVDQLRLSGGEFLTEPRYSSTIEAENFLDASPFSPLEVDTDSNTTFISWPTSESPIMPQGDSIEGQAHYSVRAFAPSMTFYATVNLDGVNNDSFHYKLEGHTSGWLTQNGHQTTGFEELEIGSWTGLTPGQTYTLKILRREDGAQLDKLRLKGGRFIIEAPFSSSP